MQKHAVHTSRLRRMRFAAVVPMLSLMSLPIDASADDAARLSTTRSDGQKQVLELAPGHVAYEVGGPGGHHTTVVDFSEIQRVIVELRGAPLAAQRVPEAGARRTAGALSSVLAASEALDAQHARVRQAIDALAGQAPQARGAAAASAVEIEYEYRNTLNGFALRAPGWLVEQLRANPEVAAIQPDVTVYADLAQSVPLIGATELHAQGLTGEGIVVGIIDTGIDYTHPDLGGGFGPGFKVIGGYDFVNRDDDPRDDAGHGTHVAGTVAANGTQKGVAPGAKLVAYKVLGAGGSGSSAGIIAAIERSVDPDGDPTTDDRLDVINLSLGGTGDADDPMSRAIDTAVSAGVVAVISAGNSGPGYQTIGSPGLARRALTVGASDKSDRLASFSSRGPSDRIYGVKPEVVAPGASIVAPFLGGGTRSLSGTSMAAPHVAGAAALLLQARPTLSPDGVKSVLMTSARDLGLNLFAQGTGRINVPAAVRRTTIVSPAAISFGVDDIALPTFTASATVSVTNTGAASRRYAAGVVAGLPAGIGVTVTPSELELAPGATGSLVVGLTVDNAVVPNVSVDPPAYIGRLRLVAADETIQVPFAFMKGAQLRLTFDRFPSLVLVRNAAGQIWERRGAGLATTLLVPPGTYDAYAMFQTIVGTRFRHSTIVRERIAVESVTTVDIRIAEAVNLLTFEPRDEGGNIMVPRLQRMLLRRAGESFEMGLAVSGLPSIDFAFSPLGAPHHVDWLNAADPAPDRAYSFFWHRAGIQASETLTNQPAELTALDFRLDADPGTTSVDVIHWNEGVAGTIALGLGNIVTLPPPFAWKRIVMPKPEGDSLFGFVDDDVLIAPAGAPPAATVLAYTTPWFKRTGQTTSVHTLDFGTDVTATPLYETSRTSFDVGLEPYSWFGRFGNAADSIRLRPAYGLISTLFLGQTMDYRSVPQLPFELRQGDTLVRSGTVPGDRSIPPMPITPGRYTLKLQGPAGSLDGQPTATTVKATFDTAAADRNPPTLSHFRILANGKPSKAFCIGERAEIRFRVTDDVRLRHVQLKFRLGAQGLWLPWLLQTDGADLVARLPLGSWLFPNLCGGSQPLQALPITVKIEATDAQGNTLETEMTPAYARTFPRTHAVPLRIDTP